MTALSEKGGGTFAGIKLLLCENPLPPIEEAIIAAQAELPQSNYYTEAYSAPLRRFIAESNDVPERLIHINVGDPMLGPGYMRLTTALPDDNIRIVPALQELL